MNYAIEKNSKSELQTIRQKIENGILCLMKNEKVNKWIKSEEKRKEI